MRSERCRTSAIGRSSSTTSTRAGRVSVIAPMVRIPGPPRGEIYGDFRPAASGDAGHQPERPGPPDPRHPDGDPSHTAEVTGDELAAAGSPAARGHPAVDDHLEVEVGRARARQREGGPAVEPGREAARGHPGAGADEPAAPDHGGVA